MSYSDHNRTHSLASSVRAFIRVFRRAEIPFARGQQLFDLREALAPRSSRSAKTEEGSSAHRALTLTEEEFLQHIAQIVWCHLRDPDFDTRALARKAGVSRMHLNRKLQALTGCSTHDFILALRFRKARQILRQDSPLISVVAQAVGFRSPSHFAKAFRERFGVSPSDFVRNEAMNSR